MGWCCESGRGEIYLALTCMRFCLSQHSSSHWNQRWTHLLGVKFLWNVRNWNCGGGKWDTSQSLIEVLTGVLLNGWTWASEPPQDRSYGDRIDSSLSFSVGVVGVWNLRKNREKATALFTIGHAHWACWCLAFSWSPLSTVFCFLCNYTSSAFHSYFKAVMKLSMASSLTAMVRYLGQRALCSFGHLIILTMVGFMRNARFSHLCPAAQNSNIVLKAHGEEGRECSPSQSSTQTVSQQHMLDVCKGCCAISADL